jgi:hypothetical protein
MSGHPPSSTSSKPSSRPNIPESGSSEPPRSSSSGHHHEDRLGRTWRAITSALIVSLQKAEKVAVDPTAKKELDESIVGCLRTRVEWSRSIAYLEAKLEGKAEEIEVLQHFNQNQPKLGNRKRKRDEDIAERIAAASVGKP